MSAANPVNLLLLIILLTGCSHIETSKPLYEFQIMRGQEVLVRYQVEVATAIGQHVVDLNEGMVDL